MIMCQYAKRRFTRKLKQLNCIIKNILLLRQQPAAKQIECHEGNKWLGNKQPATNNQQPAMATAAAAAGPGFRFRRVVESQSLFGLKLVLKKRT